MTVPQRGAPLDWAVLWGRAAGPQHPCHHRPCPGQARSVGPATQGARRASCLGGGEQRGSDLTLPCRTWQDSPHPAKRGPLAGFHSCLGWLGPPQGHWARQQACLGPPWSDCLEWAGLGWGARDVQSQRKNPHPWVTKGWPWGVWKVRQPPAPLALPPCRWALLTPALTSFHGS